MIGEMEVYHGAALVRMCRGLSDRSLAIRLHEKIRSAYLVDERVGIYVKYSTNRLSPWPFSFSSAHQADIISLKDECEEVFITLVCGMDGIACLDLAEYSLALDADVGVVEWIKATRRPREKYTVTGSDSRKSFKIGDNEYPSKVYSALGYGF